MCEILYAFFSTKELTFWKLNQFWNMIIVDPMHPCAFALITKTNSKDFNCELEKISLD